MRVLQGNGYATAGFGKWHLTPDHLQGAAGPLDRWPNAWGFDHFWGFLGGEAGQYDPLIIQDNATIGVPEGSEDKQFYLPDDLTDRAIAGCTWCAPRIRSSRGLSTTPPAAPTRRTRSPPNGARSIAASSTRVGTSCARRRSSGRSSSASSRPTRSSRLGPDALPAWDSLSDNEKKLYARQMEVYAGYQENADRNVGRLLDAIEDLGELDNTLVIYIFGDNGASLEGTVTGSFNEMTMQNGIALTNEQQLSLIGQYGGLDAWGTDAFAPHYAAAWAWAGNTPFQWGKQVGSHLGGLRDGMAVSWPERIKDSGGLRSQFTHCIDLGPDDPRGRRHPRGRGHRRDRAGADARHEPPLHLRRRRRPRAAHRPILRDLREPGDLQGRLVGMRASSTASHGT